MNKIEKMRNSMLAAGKLTIEQIDEICELEEAFIEECKEIALECEEEGLPSHGSTYDLRVESLREWYDEQIDAICEE